MRARDGNRYRDRRCPAACQSLVERNRTLSVSLEGRTVTAPTLWMIYSASKGTCRFNEQILRQCALPSPHRAAYEPARDECARVSDPSAGGVKFAHHSRERDGRVRCAHYEVSYKIQDARTFRDGMRPWFPSLCERHACKSVFIVYISYAKRFVQAARV